MLQLDAIDRTCRRGEGLLAISTVAAVVQKGGLRVQSAVVIAAGTGAGNERLVSQPVRSPVLKLPLVILGSCSVGSITSFLTLAVLRLTCSDDRSLEPCWDASSRLLSARERRVLA
jgi:hypothetical protein